MIRDRIFAISLFVSILLILLIGITRPREIDWTPTLSANDKIPFGNYILYHSLGDIFGDSSVFINDNSPYLFLHDDDRQNTTMIFIQPDFRPPLMDARELLSFVASGNNLFIAAQGMGGDFSDTLMLRERSYWPGRFIGMGNQQIDTENRYVVNFTSPGLKADTDYRYRGAGNYMHYKIDDTTFLQRANDGDSLLTEVTVLGTDQWKHPDFIRLKYGVGYIFLHSYPYAFSNYYMLKPHNREYVAKCLSYLPKGNIVWDEFYKREDSATHTPLSFILSKEPLRWAYYVTIFSLLAYVLFNIKRRQRRIPVIDPYRNTSLEFVRTVGTLYYNQGDHKNIAMKQVTYLLEFIRNRYRLSTLELGDEFVRKVSYKSGLEADRVALLVTMIGGIQAKSWASSTELIDLNENIEYFKKHCQ